MKDERYNVFALSSEGRNVDGVKSIEYSYDWGLLPEGEYELTWALTMQEHLLTLAQMGTLDIAMIEFQGLNAYTNQVGGAVWGSGNVSSQIIGLLDINAPYHYTDGAGDKVAAVQILASKSNPPIRVRSVPQGKFIINILKADGTPVAETTIAEYVLSMCFRRLDC
tara:strand:+ start:1191 stop:1688 length:498 start_codon:yes stop_codon:yes gene_type:complete